MPEFKSDTLVSVPVSRVMPPQVESAGMGPGASSSTAGLEQLSACLKQRFGEAQALFQSFDSARKGCLQYPDLGRLIKKLLPGMGSKEKRHIFSKKREAPRLKCKVSAKKMKRSMLVV
eukprot:scaffold205012_cov21-Tisochrysis_lutea.AAC.1